MRWRRLLSRNIKRMVVIALPFMIFCENTQKRSYSYSSFKQLPSSRSYSVNKQYIIKHKKFLSAIKKIESSNGRNTNHKVINTGLHRGDSAVGYYGLMPKTIAQFSKTGDECQHEIADRLASFLHKKCKGESECMAAGWYWGHSLSKEKLDSLLETSYVNKFRRIVAEKD